MCGRNYIVNTDAAQQSLSFSKRHRCRNCFRFMRMQCQIGVLLSEPQGAVWATELSGHWKWPWGGKRGSATAKWLSYLEQHLSKGDERKLVLFSYAILTACFRLHFCNLWTFSPVFFYKSINTFCVIFLWVVVFYQSVCSQACCFLQFWDSKLRWAMRLVLYGSSHLSSCNKAPPKKNPKND